MKLSSNDKHLMRLIRKDQDPDGWVKVSKAVWPFVFALPVSLVQKQETGEGGYAKLTAAGNTVLDWL